MKKIILITFFISFIYLFCLYTRVEPILEETQVIKLNNCTFLDFDSLGNKFKENEIDLDQQLSNRAKGMVRSVNIPPSVEKTVFLTFDACGQGGLSDGFDSTLIELLVQEEICVSFFISKRWALKNPSYFNYLIKNKKTIEILNHGTQHVPVSSKGDSIYGVVGTNGLREVFNEVENSAVFFCEKLDQKPKLFRPGTSYGDEISVQLINQMGYNVISYSVLGDGGATFSKEKITKNIINSKNGDIILLHLNHPESNVFEGVKEAIKIIKKRGSPKFRKLSEFSDYFKIE